MKIKRIALIVVFGLWAMGSMAQVLISDGAGSADASAALEVRSTERGLLPPNMTTAERDAIGTPAYGLIVFNTTTSKLNIYFGSWEELTTGNAAPVGVIQAFMGTTTPEGWLLCDGSTFNGATYLELQTVLGGTTLPDLRDKFLRGNPSSGRTLGSLQAYATARPNAAFQTNISGYHSHWGGKMEFYDDPNIFAYGKLELTGTGWVGSNTNALKQGLAETSSNGNHSHTITGGGDSETRPVNVSVNYIIKAR